MTTGTTDPTIVDGLTSLPDKPAAAAQGGASGQWQMLQPAGQPPAPPEAQIKGVSASHDPWIGALGLPRSSSLTRSGALGPVDSPAELTRMTLKSSVSKGQLSPIGQAHSWPPHAGSNGNRTPVPVPRAWRNGAGTNPVRCASAGRAVGQARTLACLSLRAGGGLLPLVPSRQAVPAPDGRAPRGRKKRSQRS